MLKIRLAACALSVCMLGATPAIAGTCPSDWPAATADQIRAAMESPSFEGRGRNKKGKYTYRSFHKKIGPDTYAVSVVSIWGPKKSDKYPNNGTFVIEDGVVVMDWVIKDDWIDGASEAFTDGEGNWCFHSYDDQFGDDNVTGVFVEGDPFGLEPGLPR